MGQLGVDYLRAAQRRKNLLVGAGGQKPLGAKPYGRKVLTFVMAAAIPYLVQRTALEATYELSFRRYTHSLTRSLRLDSVLGGDARALTAVAASDLNARSPRVDARNVGATMLRISVAEGLLRAQAAVIPDDDLSTSQGVSRALCPCSWRWTGRKLEVLLLSRKRSNGDGRRPRL